MSHENSVTEQDPATGLWMNRSETVWPRDLDGPYLDRETAESAARRRSKDTDPLTLYAPLSPLGSDPPSPAPGAPPAAPQGSPDLLALGNFLAAQGRLSANARARAEAIRPEIDAAAKQGDETAARAAATIPQPPALPPPPSRQLHGFLAPTENEKPEVSVSKFIGALGLFASGAAGLSKGNARGALAALTGALKGWQEGDAERADREYADWKAKTDTLLKDFDNRRAAWEDWFKASKLSMTQKVEGLKLRMLADGMELDADKLETEGPKYLFETMDRWRHERDEIELHKQRIEAQREAAQNTNEYRAARLAIENRKADDAKASNEAAVAAYDNPQTLAMLGQQYAVTGKLPPNIARGKSGQVLIPKIVNAAADWARAQGLDPMNLPAIQAEVQSAQKSLIDTKKRHAVAEVAVGTFERHMAQLVELGAKVDRSQRPVINRYVLKSKGQYQGDADVANFEAMALEAAQEFAKVSVGTAQGDAGTREEARHAINTALNQQQLEGVAATLKRAAQSRMAQYRETEERLMHTIQAPMQPQAAHADPAKAPAGGARKRIVITNGTDRGEVYEDSAWQTKYPGWKAE